MSKQEVDLGLLLDPGDQLDLTKLAESALKSFALIKRWYQAKGFINHNLVATAIDRVTDQADAYRLAITLSLETAQDGRILAGDALCLCDHISAGTASVQVLGQFVGDMLDLARKAEERALKMQEQFRTVRRALHKISRDILSYTVEIQKDLQGDDQHGLSPPDDGDTTFVLLPISHGVNVVNDATEENTQTGSNSRDSEQKSVTDTVSELHQVYFDLTELVDYVGSFVDWWSQIKAKLLSLWETIPMIRLDGSNPFRTATVQSRWMNVKGQYTLYHIQIVAIQDYHHYMLPCGRPTNLDIADMQSVTSSQAGSPPPVERHRQHDEYSGRSFFRLVRGALGGRKGSGS